MDKEYLKRLLLHKRMEIKAEIEQFRFLSEFTNGNYENRINEKLDLLNEIDLALEKLKE